MESLSIVVEMLRMFNLSNFGANYSNMLTIEKDAGSNK